MAAVAAGVLLGMHLRGKSPSSADATKVAEKDATEQTEDIRAGEAAKRAEAAKKADAERTEDIRAGEAMNRVETEKQDATSSPSSPGDDKSASNAREPRRKTRLAVNTSASSFGPRVILRARVEKAENAEGGEEWQTNNNNNA